MTLRTPWREAFRPAGRRPRGPMKLVGPHGVVAERVEVALTPMARLRGWLRRPSVEADQALILHPCTQVHTFGMRFAVDAVFVDDDLVVQRVVSLEPGHLSPLVRRASACIELPSGRAAACGIEPGSRLSVAEA